ncbi:endonuclease/exonuclease/phosphatase family protein [Testudinibacter sp. P80/BLE/0925]|uniref:endonuclease/exonuclease/phosphatase family protein n=1 Tax=Testudinibacter sp. TW-1 TaxID=3417757 RepID=UPI003D3660FF
MRKRIRILCVLFAVLIGLGGYYLQPLTIFTTPKIETVNLNPQDYRQSAVGENILCYDRTLPLHGELQAKARYKMLVWNLHKGEDEGWQQRLSAYADKADFVLLQEASQQNQIDRLLSQKKWFGIHAGTFAYRENMSGVMLLSTFAPQRYCVGSEAEPWIRIPKIAEAATYPLNADRTLLVINLHLVNFEWNPLNYSRQLRGLFHLVSQHQGPIILAGDFNSWSERRLNLIQQLARQYGLNEVRFSPDERMRFLGNPLDHIFVRGIRLFNSWTEQTAASDHNPLFIEFGLE